MLESSHYVTDNSFPLQTVDQFEMDGCENCDSFLHMKDNRDHVFECTSNNFDGLVEQKNVVRYPSMNLWKSHLFTTSYILMITHIVAAWCH